MTEVIERADADAGAAAATAARRPAHASSRTIRWRVATRLARRQVRRAWGSSLLVVLLVMLPIAGMAAAAVLVDSSQGTPEERVRAELGQMQAWVQPSWPAGSQTYQSPTEPTWTSSYDQGAGAEVPVDPFAALPAGTEAIEVSEGRERVRTADGIGAFSARGGAVWDERFEGRYALVSGRAPVGADEVLVTAAALDRLDATVGGTVELVDSEQTVTITGVIDVVRWPRSESGIVFADAARYGNSQWFLPELSLDWDDVLALNDAGIAVYSRDVVLNPPTLTMGDPGYQEYDPYWAAMGTLLLTLGIAGGAAAYVVIMLSGAAFAVAARRQQRALAIAASVGATSRDIHRTVLLQGTVLGLIGGAIGIGAGIGLAWILMTVTTSSGFSMAYWGFHVPWLLLAGILLFAVIVGTISALVPARTVARADVIGALRGARRPQKVDARRPIWGSVMILVGVGITVLAGIGAAWLVTAYEEVPWDSPLRWIIPSGIIVGPVLAQLGIVLSGRWLLWLASLVLSKLSLAARLASRDAVANASRTVPAFAAIGATVFVGVFAVAQSSMAIASQARTWSYSAPVGSATVEFYPTDWEAGPLTPEQAQDAIAAAEQLATESGAERTAVIQTQVSPWDYAQASSTEVPFAMARYPDAVKLTADSDAGDEIFTGDPNDNLSFIAADDLEATLGVRLTDAQRDDYRAGAALVLDPRLVTSGAVALAAWTGADFVDGRVPGNSWVSGADESLADPLWEKRIDAIVVDALPQLITVAMSPDTAAGLDIQAQPKRLVASFAVPPTTAQRDRMAALADSATTDVYSIWAYVENGPPAADAWVLPLLGGVSLLVLGASAVALALARYERRPDDATLSAVGGTRGLRRRVGFWQALVIAGFGTFAGVAAGILPPIGFVIQTQGNSYGELLLTDVPWGTLALFAVGLPLLIAVVNWLVPPRHPELTRRTVIA